MTYFFCTCAAISVYSFPLRLVGGDEDDGAEAWVVVDEPLKECVTGVFLWAQWCPAQHHLYYLHHRPPPAQATTIGLGQSL